MDGNRRFARQRKLETVEGHNLGFEALARILEVCYKSGVKVVTIYAFSIENFKRSKWEVDALMDMAKTKLVQMAAHGELFEQYGARVNVLGDRSLVREDVLKQVDKAAAMTADNDRAVLNVCFPYTSREEMTHAVRETVRDFTQPVVPEQKPKKKMFSESHIQRTLRSRKLDAVEEEAEPTDHTGLAVDTEESTFLEPSEADSSDIRSDPDSTPLNPASSRTSRSPSPIPKTQQTNTKPSSLQLPDPESINTATLTKNMYTADAPPLDLLVRTSGVKRLSDFMLWQCHEKTEMRFLDCMWPEFDLWHFLPVLLEWQWGQRKRLEQQARSEHGKTKGIKSH